MRRGMRHGKTAGAVADGPCQCECEHADRPHRPVRPPGSMWAAILRLSAAILMGGLFSSCSFHGERITQTVVEDRVLPLKEFRVLFREEDLFSRCYWYCGNRGGYSYVEIDDDEPIDKYDDMFNRRVHHTLRRFRVAETEVVFTPAMPFSGYGKGKRIMAPRFADADSVTFRTAADK